MKLCVSYPCPIWVSESFLNTLQKDVQCLHLGCPSYNCHGLIRCPDLCRASAHERKCIQDLHSPVCKGIGLHSDGDPNGSYEFFGLVLISIEWFGISGLGASGWVVQGLDRYAGLGVCCDSLCHCGCRSRSHTGNVVVCVCDLGLEKGIQFPELLQLFMLAFEE